MLKKENAVEFIYLKLPLSLSYWDHLDVWVYLNNMTSPGTRPNTVINSVCTHRGGPETFLLTHHTCACSHITHFTLHIQEEIASRQLVLVLSHYGSRYTCSSFPKKLKENHHSVSLVSKENVQFLIFLFLMREGRHHTLKKNASRTK